MKNKFFYLFATVIDRYGTTLFIFIANLYMIQQTGNTRFAGIVLGLASFISLISNIYAGTIVDHFNKKKVLIYANLIAAVVNIGFALWMNDTNTLTIFALLIILLKITGTITSIANKVIIKYLFVQKEEIHTMNGYDTIIKEVVNITSPLLASLLFIYDVKIFVIINGFSFLIAAILQFFYEEKLEEEHEDKRKNYIESWRLLKSEKGIFSDVLLATISNFYFAGVMLYIPYMAIQVYDSIWYNTFFAMCLAIGSIIGATLNKVIAKKLANITTTHYIFTAAIITILGGFSPILLGIASVLIGVVVTLFNVQFFSNVQYTIKGEYLGKIISIIFLLAGIFTPLGNIFFGIVGPFFGSYCLQVTGVLFFISIICATYYGKQERLKSE